MYNKRKYSRSKLHVLRPKWTVQEDAGMQGNVRDEGETQADPGYRTAGVFVFRWHCVRLGVSHVCLEIRRVLQCPVRQRDKLERRELRWGRWMRLAMFYMLHLIWFSVGSLVFPLDCGPQDENFSLVFTVASFMNNFLTLPNGFFYDHFGTMATRLLAMWVCPSSDVKWRSNKN